VGGLRRGSQTDGRIKLFLVLVILCVCLAYYPEATNISNIYYNEINQSGDISVTSSEFPKDKGPASHILYFVLADQFLSADYC
jgi:hypothetical protein